MVATRRGVRVYSPTQTNSDQPSDVPATPSTGRRTRSNAKQAESSTQHAQVETSSQLEKSRGGPQASPPASALKRCTRASRLHSPELPCTPVGSTHEADVSDVESCTSVVEIKLPMTRTRGRRGQPRTVSQEDEDISEVESCCSAVSASEASQSSRRSTRRKAIPKSLDPSHVEERDVKLDLGLETESCSSVVSDSQRVTRSQRRTTRTRSSAKQQTEDSDADSIAGAEVSKSTTRRATRSKRQTCPIPIYLGEGSESSQSPAPRTRRSCAAPGKAAATADVSEPQSCESEGHESGPTYSPSYVTRRRGKTQSTGPKAIDSDSVPTDMQSPMGSPRSTQSGGTPCSSRTGSGSSSRGAWTTRSSVKTCSIVLEKATEPAEEDTSLNYSRLESTVIFEGADSTLLEEDVNQTLEEKEREVLNSTALTSNEADTRSMEKEVIISEEDSTHVSPLVSDSPGCAEEVVIKPAVTLRRQQEEMCAMNKDKNISEMEMIQEVIAPSEALKPGQSVTVTVCESASEILKKTEEKDEAMEVAYVDTYSSQGAEAVDEDEDAIVDTGPSEQKKMEVSSLLRDAQQVVDSSEVRVKSIQVASNQHNVTVGSDPEQQPKDVIVENAKKLTLLESSEDEDVEEEEDFGYRAEERAGLTHKCEAAAAASVDGLFMIDTRPGQEADEQYYKDKPTEEEKAQREERVEQEEQDEEFVDEDGEDDDDEDAEILFSSRNPQLKELSSRIDPGIRVKELGGLYINFDGSKSKPVSSSLQKLKEKKIQDEVMKKSVMGPDFEKKDAVPPYSESKQAQKLKRRTEREKSTGDGWFNMKAPEITQELKGDLQVLKMRGSMDPKRFYKKNDRDGFPKYFQVGTVVDSAIDFYHSRVPKKSRKRTMVEELLSDAEFRQNNKKKYQHIVTEKAAHGAGKRNKKKNKFHKK